MNLTVIIVIAAVIAALVIGGAVWNARMKDKRRNEMAGWAFANGLKFSANKDTGLWFRYDPFKFLQRGENYYAYNVMYGTVAGRVTCGFDYHYETHSSDSKGNRQTHHHYFSALALDAGFPLKELSIRPEGLLDRVGEFVGLDDIDFESAEFSRKFHVTAPDRRWAYDVIHQKTMELMLTYPRFHIDFRGSQVMAYHPSKTFSIAEFSQALKVAGSILDLIPESVISDLKEGYSGGHRL